MGKAKVECVNNCKCGPVEELDFLWQEHSSQAGIHKIEAEQHGACEVRITVLNATSDLGGGHKVKLLGLMVAEAGKVYLQGAQVDMLQ